MRVLVLGGTAFIGRRIVERLHERGDQVLVVHRGLHEPAPWVPVSHLRTDRSDLGQHADRVRDFKPAAVVDTYALTENDVMAVLGVLPEVPTVVLSSQDVYQAFTGLRTNRCESPVPLTEDSELRRDRYPYRGAGIGGVPDDYSSDARTSCCGGSALDGRECQWEPATSCGPELMSMTSLPAF